VAWHPIGWKAAWYSEIEPFPSAVLKHHYPTVPNYGDMTQYEAWPNEPINLLVGGTPCQSFSVAGLRKGLADPRGNLMLTYGAIAKRYSPKWLVWENVPGVLSSNGGRDFGTFLGMLAELGYGFAYRVLDAQYFGVAQRRRRVFVVGYLGDWRRAAAVLFERHSLCGHPPPSRETRQDAAKCLTASLGMRLDPTSETFPIAPTLQAHDGAKWGSNQWVDEGKAIVQPVAETLIASDHKGPGHNRDHNFVAQPVAFQSSQSGVRLAETHATLDANNGPRRHNGVVSAMQVRRLTPVECERLQGFPDGYTNISWRGKSQAPDGPRYKAMGNSMAVPVMHWIGKRIAAVNAL